MAFPLEAVPNFSEGRDRTIVDALADALSSSAELLDVHSDPDHNRSVFTLAADEDALVDALLAAIAVACERIDLRRHDGVHPCIGSADVVPIVSLRGGDAARARNAALQLAERVGNELRLPVFLYGELAGGRSLAELRRGGRDGLAHRLERGELHTDFGPASLDERAGAVVVGARAPLVAFNVNLRGSLEAAREIASLVRESGGGFPGVRALGLELSRAGVVQVSLNVERFEEAPLEEIVSRIEREASLRGASVLESELVGLLPAGAVLGASRAALRLPLLDSSRLIELNLLERRGLGA